MHTIHFLAQAIPNEWKDPLPCDPAEGTCCITGETCLTIPRKKLLTNTFTDEWAYVAPNSDRVSVDAWNVFKAGYYSVDDNTGKPKTRKKKVETMACWWTDGKTWEIELDRNKQRIRDFLFYPPATRWAAYVTTTYKKHGSLRAPVNAQAFGRWGFNETVVDASHQMQVSEWWKILRTAQEDGIPRPVLESMDIHASIHPEKLLLWIELQAWGRDKVNSPLFRFLCYLLPSKKELTDGYRDEYTLHPESSQHSHDVPPVQGELF